MRRQHFVGSTSTSGDEPARQREGSYSETTFCTVDLFRWTRPMMVVECPSKCANGNARALLENATPQRETSTKRVIMRAPPIESRSMNSHELKSIPKILSCQTMSSPQFVNGVSCR
jgi:hypothetical protein